MDVSRLLEVLIDIEQDSKAGYTSHLGGVVQAYAKARDNPAQDLSDEISAATTELAESLSRGVFNDYPPSKKHILDAIGGSSLVGEDALSTLRSRLSAVGFTGAALAEAAAEFFKEAESFRKKCAQTKAGLLAIKIEPHSIEPGTSEVGVLIPAGITGGTLAGLKAQLNTWNIALKGFSELAEEPAREIPLKGLATGSIEVYVTVSLLTAKLIAFTIDKTLAWYKQVLAIQQARQQLANVGGPVAEIGAARAHEKKLLDQAITGIVDSVMKEAKTKLQASRKQEIETQLTISVRHIARFVDRGGDVEVTAGAPEVPDEPVQAEGSKEEAGRLRTEYLEKKKEYDRIFAEARKAEEISRMGSALRSLPPRKEPILQLGDAEEEQDQSKKTAKAEKRK